MRVTRKVTDVPIDPKGDLRSRPWSVVEEIEEREEVVKAQPQTQQMDVDQPALQDGNAVTPEAAAAAQRPPKNKVVKKEIPSITSTGRWKNTIWMVTVRKRIKCMLLRSSCGTPRFVLCFPYSR
jgi:hypothetical protein